MQMKRKPKLGQNFLVDDSARHAIVDALGDLSKRTVIEIGPGHGAITDILAARCRKLIALELDRGLAAELTFRFRDHPQVQILERDVLKTDLRTLVPEGETADVIGNLPYYITSDILLQLFAAGSAGILARAVLMMQREVADRVSAAPGVRDYGLLSATAQMNAQVDNLFTLPPSAFSPPPDVYSTVLRLHFAPRFAELGVDPEGFNLFLKWCFAQKRKTLQNNLRAADYSSEDLSAAWTASIPAQARAESLALESMAELYRSLSHVVADRD
jgi:16S rRNA (adenine1518-N6/adenine1519-N6)-dimethyltransferase